MESDTRFWIATALVILLVLMSWCRTAIVGCLDRAFRLPYPASDYLELGLRLILIVPLVWVFRRFRRKKGTADPRKVQLVTTRSFDPLMGLRAFACSLVLLGHFFLVVYIPAGYMSVTGVHETLSWLLVGSPWGGVWVFFTRSPVI